MFFTFHSQKCYVCRKNGANIRCFRRSCKISFHLTCGLQEGCQFEFTGEFNSYCELHHNIEQPNKIHSENDLCTICYDEMGEYDPMNSIQLPCCTKDAWYHKMCLVKYAQTAGDVLKCPLCNNLAVFRQSIAEHGVFIPFR